MSLYILIISTILQFCSAGLAFSYYWRKKTNIFSWLLISSGLFLMAVRRAVTLYQALTLERVTVNPAPESVALLISILMLAGVWRLESFFNYIIELKKNSEVELENRTKIMEELAAANEQKETLIKEIHHRVKNNLFIVISLLEMQKMKNQDKKIKDALQLSINRMHSMALIHKEIYGTESYARMELSRYLKSLVDNLKEATVLPDQQVEIRYDLDEIVLKLDQIIPCALAVNELVSNAFVHGFSGKEQGILKIELNVIAGEVQLTVANDGHPLPEDLDFDRYESSMGLNLVKKMVNNQLQGEFDYKENDWVSFKVSFPVQQ